MPDPNGAPAATSLENEPVPPPSSSLLARAVWTLVQAHEVIKILALGPYGAVVKVGTKATLTLVVWEESGADELGRRLRILMKQHVRGVFVAGVVGGGDAAREVLKKAKPMLTNVKVGLVHVDETGRLWSKDAGVVQEALADIERTPYPSQGEWADLVERTAADRAEFAEESKEAMEFATVFHSRGVHVTSTLAVLLLAVFALEHLFGGTESVPVLLRMGALSPERVLGGEVWRLFSCTFLHSGWSHLFFNVYVLWVLGTSLERVLGRWRLLVLYGLSCLGSSLLSLVFLDGFSVGASGGLWGFLVADAVLAWRTQGLLPRSAIQAARRATAINLIINLLNSFRPHVDMWGHFGGGAVAAVLMLTGMLTRGLPRLGEMEGEVRPDEVEIRSGTFLRAAGSTLAAALVLGLALGLWTGKPWALKGGVERVRTPLPSLGISLSLPEGLERIPGAPGEPSSVAVGNFLTDMGAVAVTRYPMDLSDEALVLREHEALTEALKKPPEGARLSDGPDDVSVMGRKGVAVIYRFNNGLEEDLAFGFLADALVKVDSVRWPEFKNAVPPGYAVQVLDSLEPLPAEDDGSRDSP